MRSSEDSSSLGKAKAVQPLLGKAVKAHPFIHTKDNQSDEEMAIDCLSAGRFSACYQRGSDVSIIPGSETISSGASRTRE